MRTIRWMKTIVIPVFEDPAFVKGMTYIKELWDAGAIDPELMLNDMSKKEEKFYQGKARHDACTPVPSCDSP